INQVQIYNKLVAIFYNTKDPILSDKNLRKALNCVAPNVTDEERIQSPIPKTSWAFSDETKGCIDDLAQAKSYFAKVQNGKDSTITLVTTPNLSAVGEQVVTAWKSLGMNTVLRVESGIPQNFQALLIAQTVPKDPDQYALWHSTQTTTNLSQLKSDRIDKDLEDGRKTTDNQVRKDRYADFQKLLIEDPPATFLYFDKMNIVYRQNIANQLKKVINYQIYEE
ncbi:MAG: hypothetical protein M1607_01685, partial [Patescibacteria group bacterium]|nr:hypothetical protein [Patescibacteria group bacterium]